LDIEGFGDDLLTMTRQRFVWLWYWLGVLVVGCSGGGGNSGDPLLIRTPTPRLATLALLGWTLTPVSASSATATAVPRLLRTATIIPSLATPALPLTLTAAPLPSLHPDAPQCYETPTGSVYCLGVVENTLLLAVAHLTVRVYLVDAAGSALAQGDSAVAQALLLPGERAPYGVLFDSAPQGMIGGVTALIDAQEVRDKTASIVRLTIKDTVREDLQVRGVVVNSAATAIERVCVVVTLFDEYGAVTGFKVWQSGALAPLPRGDTLTFDLFAIPQGHPTHDMTITAEGIAAGRDEIPTE
jgi:hypothetical protein